MLFLDLIIFFLFYPFIEADIGTNDCKMLFTESKQHQPDVISICSSVLDDNISTQQQVDNKETCAEQTKSISIFTRIVGNIYETDGIIAAGIITCNPFDLSHKIHL